VSDLHCTREHDVVSLVLSGRWDDSDPALREHADGCSTCREVVAIASVLRMDRERLADVPVPAVGQVWWRSAIRARAEAAEAAARPMVWLQALTGAAAIGIVVAGISMMWPKLTATLRLALPSNGASMQEALPLLLFAVLAVIAAPIAFYLTVPRD
jgi:hypothetical protein